MIEFIKNHIALSVTLFCVVIALIALVWWILWANKALKLNKISISAPCELKIAHISDFHNAKLKNSNACLVDMIRDAKPDIIAITGDLVDSRHTDVDVSIDLARELVKIAPCYYVPGNHESRIENEYNTLKQALTDFGVTILCDSKTTLEKNGQTFTIIGIEDPMFVIEKDSVESTCEVIRGKLEPLSKGNEGYTILLSHRPEAFEEYVSAGVDLALTGHAHGGQMQIPFVGGLIAPNQGFFPKYSEGLHQKDKTSMVISRGIGNSLCPLRVNNRPELILIELK
jgi:predicted MPP superfamily phosphohydrolase